MPSEDRAWAEAAAALRLRETDAGKQLFARGALRLLESGRSTLVYLVEGCEVRLGARGAACSCAAFRSGSLCRHTVAAGLQADKDGLRGAMARQESLDNGEALLAMTDGEFTVETVLRAEVTLTQDDAGIGASLRIGEDRLYVVRSLPAFFQSVTSREPLFFSRGFTYRPDGMRFDPASWRAVSVLRTVCEGLEATGRLPTGAQAKTLPLGEGSLCAMLEVLREQPFRFCAGGETLELNGIPSERVPMRFRVGGSLRGLTIRAGMPEDVRPLTRDAGWVLCEGRVLRVGSDQRALLRLMLRRCEAGVCDFSYSAAETPRAAGELIPALMLNGAVELEPALARHTVREPLTVRVWLDQEGKSIAARVTYIYGDWEINPFEADRSAAPRMRGEALLLRDAAAERRVLGLLDEAGFRVRTGRALLSGTEAVWRFVSGGADRLREAAEVYLSRDFERVIPRRPTLNGRIGLRGGDLLIQLRLDEESTPEMLEILRAISRRKDYVRLESGAFLDLREMREWQGLAEEITAAADQRAQTGEGDIRTAPYRIASLNRLLQDEALPVQWEETVREAVRCLNGEIPEDVPLPDGLALRPYQQTGFRWLAALDRLRMGGILADDMGLGKTVQFIALIRAVHTPGSLSLVVTPTSLTYNWMAEFRRFAPEIRPMVLTGTQPQREQTLRSLVAAGETDVLIVSYPLLRRDIDLIEALSFRVVALDEAQQIKNAGSVSAAAVRRLRGESRFALTGTPLENHAGELWSLFDFILPGYLGPYGEFMRRYQDGQRAEELHRRLRPFLLRRVKTDVLTELPDKLEHVLTARMTPEQEQVYRASRLRLNRRVDDLLREKGLSRGRIEVLAAITELREICCHPALVMDGYAGTSGKLAMLSDLLPGALASGRRVLLFSQFTSMLKIIRRHLESEGIRCLYLDGDTPAERRLDLTERFNAGEGDVFLISLKAGGTGLNLTGADLVIHYDPWWNPAAEDQATDRAHRIGQTRQVEVIRLITHDTVEEQVMALGERKRALFDRLIAPGEEMVTALTEQDIRSLFN